MKSIVDKSWSLDNLVNLKKEVETLIATKTEEEQLKNKQAIENFSIGDVFRLNGTATVMIMSLYQQYGNDDQKCYFFTGLKDNFLKAYSDPPISKQEMIEHLIKANAQFLKHLNLTIY